MLVPDVVPLCTQRELSIVRQQRPDDACILRGHGNDRSVITATRAQRYRPARHAIRLCAALRNTARAPSINNVRKYASPRLVMRPKRALPPVEY